MRLWRPPRTGLLRLAPERGVWDHADMSRSTDEETRRIPEVEVREPEDADDFEEFETESIMSLLSSTQRAGTWEVADRIEAFALMGDVKLDFAKAHLPASGVVEIHAVSIMGQVTISVPEGAEVEMKGFPVLGSFEQKTRRRRRTRDVVREWVTGEEREAPPLDEEPPLFRISGVAIMGSVELNQG